MLDKELVLVLWKPWGSTESLGKGNKTIKVDKIMWVVVVRFRAM